MTARTAKILFWLRLTALVLSTSIVSVLSFGAPVLADEAPRPLNADLDKKFLQRVGEADNAELKEQIRQLRERNAAGAEPRQFQWDRLEERRPKAQPARRVVQDRLIRQQIANKGMQGRIAGVLIDGDVRVVVETVAVTDDSSDGEILPEGQPGPKQQFRIAPESCQELVFGKGRDETGARDLLDTRLGEKIGVVDSLCGLTGTQSQKLRLAGRGDIHRFFERAREMRSRIDTIFDIEDGDQRALWNRVMVLNRESRALRGTFDADPFGAGSLFDKALRRLLTPDQAVRYAHGESPASPPK